ncbi:MAG: hypothetical protein QMD95_04320 [Candidatus Hodarchaeaceae archaeon]|nr:hypothetical protein [Candidatus Hodarchaeaceae archaeon]
MRERGFMPFSAAGALIVLLVLGMVSHAAWSRHQRSMGTVDDISSSALLTLAADIQGDLRAAAKYSIYRALWEVCKQADDYDDSARERAIEQLATMYFAERVAELGPAYTKHDPRVELEIPNSNPWPTLNLADAGGGYALVQVGLPEGARIKLCSRDNSLTLALSLEEIETFIDSRYFLLQERMGEFVERRGDIMALWQIMEYVSAWAGAWVSGEVKLETSRSRAFFEAAWAIHELNTFGSSDYWAAAQGLIDAAGGGGANDLLSELNNPTVVITPISTADVESMNGYIDRALGAVESASAFLSETKEYARLARNAAVELPDNLENAGGRLENIKGMLLNAGTSLAEARSKISEVDGQFRQLLEFVGGSAPGNVMMAALHQSLTSRMLDEDYPSLQEQVGWGVEGVSAKLLELEGAVNDALAHFSEGLKNRLDGLLAQIGGSIDDLLSEPAPKRFVTFTTYGGDPPETAEERMPVYLDDKTGGTIGVLRLILGEAKNNLNKMKNLSRQFEPAPDELQEFEIDGGLSSRLGASPPEFTIDREEFYELLPPAPVQPSPGLPVFHDFDVKNVTHTRRDPAGWFHSPTATPIPLWFIGVVLWWGQWETTLELEPGPIEEIFDFDNPTLPLVHGAGYFHKPLAYRWGMPEKPYGINVVVISLRPFTISSS